MSHERQSKATDREGLIASYRSTTGLPPDYNAQIEARIKR